jgi:hypothetical protein
VDQMLVLGECLLETFANSGIYVVPQQWEYLVCYLVHDWKSKYKLLVRSVEEVHHRVLGKLLLNQGSVLELLDLGELIFECNRPGKLLSPSLLLVDRLIFLAINDATNNLFVYCASEPFLCSLAQLILFFVFVLFFIKWV